MHLNLSACVLLPLRSEPEGRGTMQAYHASLVRTLLFKEAFTVVQPVSTSSIVIALSVSVQIIVWFHHVSSSDSNAAFDWQERECMVASELPVGENRVA